MAVKLSKMQKKTNYDARLSKLLDHYTQILIVGADNVGSNQLQNIRQGLRGDSIVLMGKNTMMKRTIRLYAERTGNTNMLNLIPLIVGNVGLIFTKGDLKEVSDVVAKYKIAAPARVGLIAPIDVIVPPGNTGLDPSQTSFFQVLNIPTKINKGTVEILTPVELIKKGDKVGSSEAALLSKLKIKPFSYGLIVQSVFENGSVFSPEVLNITEDDLAEKFAVGLSEIAAFSLAIHYPTLAAAPHFLINGYKNLLSLAVATEYSFRQAEKVKEFLKDPSKFEAAMAPASSVAADSSAPAAAEKEQKKEEPEESSEEETGLMGLFD
ncbi:60S acidic ribosomal protein P0-like [Cynara cardunculus var. scolymus]|uniref:60S acidic ribosomal protein P0-like n=1 Tax=Cynara cardunculus var. scolymus TaxID=59895 RepID=UPI000D62C900|nr:60S acidic ribosomal protein P0-like [Cynara cardunculus var. scolymus]